MIAQLKRYFLSGNAQFVSAFAAEAVTLAPPTLTSTRAQAVNTATGQEYYLKNANFTDTIPASITKMMTVYTLLQHKTDVQLDDTVTVITADLQAGSGANLLAGDVISYRSLIADAMRPSSNAACAVIARVIGDEITGGVGDPFVAFMGEINDVSDAIGMTGSTWYNPAGLNGGDYTPPTSTNITTPSDMNIVMGLLWAYPVMAEMWDGGAQFYDMPLTRSGSPTSISIELLHQMRTDTGVIGGKTGTTTVANACTLWQAPSGDVIAITVFNGGTTGRYTDTRAIITELPLDFPELAVVDAGTTLTAPAIASASQVFAPSLAIGAVALTAPRIESTATLYPPQISVGPVTLTAPLIASTAQVFAPAVSAAQLITAPTLASTLQLFAPELNPGAVQLGLPLLPSSNAFYVHQITGGVPGLGAGVAFVPSPSAILFAPTPAILFAPSPSEIIFGETS